MAGKSDAGGLVEYISANLVNHPKDVDVTPVGAGQSLVVELRVNPEDLGTVIGKGGRIAKAMRTLLNSISAKQTVDEEGNVTTYSKLNLEIIDE